MQLLIRRHPYPRHVSSGRSYSVVDIHRIHRRLRLERLYHSTEYQNHRCHLSNRVPRPLNNGNCFRRIGSINNQISSFLFYTWPLSDRSTMTNNDNIDGCFESENWKANISWIHQSFTIWWKQSDAQLQALQIAFVDYLSIIFLIYPSSAISVIIWMCCSIFSIKLKLKLIQILTMTFWKVTKKLNISLRSKYKCMIT